MFNENGLTGKALVDATTAAAMSELRMSIPAMATSEAEIREAVVAVYSDNEHFDGEAVDPSAFARSIVNKIRWRS